MEFKPEEEPKRKSEKFDLSLFKQKVGEYFGEHNFQLDRGDIEHSIFGLDSNERQKLEDDMRFTIEEVDYLHTLY